MKKAVVLFSGGLDSTTALYCAKKDVGREGKLFPLTITYGQRHQREIESAGRIVDLLGLQWMEIDISDLSLLVSTSLTGEGEVPTEGVKPGIPTTWVPQRNSIFLALAFSYAETVGADMVYTGMNIVDYSGYPDCRPDFVQSMERSLNLASKKYRETGHGIGIITPLIKKSKAQIILLGTTLKVPYTLTWSCYNGRDRACGLCDSCRLRLKGFQEAGLKDPIEYELG